MTPEVGILRLAHGADLPLPAYASTGAAGADLRAAVEDELILAPGERASVPTGLVLQVPAGWEAQIRPRSGMALEHGLTLVNPPGTVDSDYRGEVLVLLINLGHDAVAIRRGDRIAQMVVAPAVQAHLVEVPAVESTRRGAGGFGSTGR